MFFRSDTMAAIAGYGKDIFDSFSPSDITALKSSLSSDPELDLESTKHKHDESCISDADGAYSHDEGFQVESLIHQEYAKLIIGNKFRPKTGGIFECKADDPDQINYQPVFLVQTPQGGYAVFMVTLFKGPGLDTQITTVTLRLISIQ